MISPLSKYHLLEEAEKKEAMDFIDFLLSKKKRKAPKKDYAKQILKVSVWSDTDLQVFAENNRLFNEWKPAEW